MKSFPKQFDREPLATALAAALGTKDMPKPNGPPSSPTAGAGGYSHGANNQAAAPKSPGEGNAPPRQAQAQGKPPDKPKLVEPDMRLWARAQSSKTAVRIKLITGDTVEGRLVSFGLYSVAIETAGTVVVVFKISMVTAQEVAR